MRSLCLLVPLALSACSNSHLVPLEPDAGDVEIREPDAGERDAGRRDAGLADGGEDAGSPSADAGGLVCPSSTWPSGPQQAGVSLCAARGFGDPSAPILELVLPPEERTCLDSIQCAVTLRDALDIDFAGVIDVRTTRCELREDHPSERCGPMRAGLQAVGRCILPPLGAAGTYLVQIDGVPAGSFETVTPPPPPASECLAAQPEAPESLICPPVGAQPHDRELGVCGPASARAHEAIEFTVVDVCGGCFDSAGHCEVRAEAPRSGVAGRISLLPYTRRCDCPRCGACEPVCERREVACTVPPLEPGVYDVYLPGARTSQLFVTDGIPRPGNYCTL